MTLGVNDWPRRKAMYWWSNRVLDGPLFLSLGKT